MIFFYIKETEKNELVARPECEQVLPDGTVCGEGFSLYATLKYHERTVHQESKVWVCSICKKECYSAWQLKSHQVSHSEHRPYACKLCDKSYKRIAELQRHEKVTHSPDAHLRHCCDICEMNFASEADLRYGH